MNNDTLTVIVDATAILWVLFALLQIVDVVTGRQLRRAGRAASPCCGAASSCSNTAERPSANGRPPLRYAIVPAAGSEPRPLAGREIHHRQVPVLSLVMLGAD